MQSLSVVQFLSDDFSANSFAGRCVGRTVATVSTAITDRTARRPITATARLAVTEVLASRWNQATSAAATSSSRVPTVGTRRRATDTASAATTTVSASDGPLPTSRPLTPTTTTSSTASVSLATLELAASTLIRVRVETLALTVERVR